MACLPRNNFNLSGGEIRSWILDQDFLSSLSCVKFVFYIERSHKNKSSDQLAASFIFTFIFIRRIFEFQFL